MGAEATVSSSSAPPDDPAVDPGAPARSARGARAYHLRGALLAGLTGALALGALAHVAGLPRLADGCWLAAAAVALAVTVPQMVLSFVRRRPGVDVIAVLALAGAIAIGELAAAAVIAVMMATGQLLEARARVRAERDLRALLDRVPTTVHRRDADGVHDIRADEVQVADVLVVKPGDAVAVDGRVVDAAAVLDLAALTGESIPVTVERHGVVRSGSVNAGSAFDLRATARAADSTFAGIVRSVEAATADTAPFVRLADRFAVVFVPVTLLLAGFAWAVSGHVERAVAVLVVATPCPLILAVPVAITSGLARAARRGVIVKGGAVLEQLARGRSLVFDKTGTVTAGRPALVDVVVAEGADPREVLRCAGSLEQASAHVLASTIVDAAAADGTELVWPEATTETMGSGLAGTVAGRSVRVGRLPWLGGADGSHLPPPAWVARVLRRVQTEGVMTVFVELDGVLAGALVFEDPLRPDASRTLRDLRACGFERLIMASGDRAAVAEAVGIAVGADEVLAECTPSEKAAAVSRERAYGVTVMVGDGVNDAPALAVADVGVALGARGGSGSTASSSSEIADVVLSVDRINRLADAVRIARRSHTVAVQSVIGGMGLAAAAMVLAAGGLLAPLGGAIVQEVIDVLAIANALRALTAGRDEGQRLEGAEAEMGRAFQMEHVHMAAGLRELRPLADDLGRAPAAEVWARLVRLRSFLDDVLLPHELHEDRDLYPVVARVLGGHDPTATMSRTHLEIARLIGLFDQLVDELGPDGLQPDPVGGPGAEVRAESVATSAGVPAEDVVAQLRGVLYGLDAVLRLHFAQEEQEYLSLADVDQ